jgi:hypothetical protein
LCILYFFFSKSCQKVVKQLSKSRQNVVPPKNYFCPTSAKTIGQTLKTKKNGRRMVPSYYHECSSSHLVKTYLDNMYLCLYTRCAVSPRSIFENVVHKHIVISNQSVMRSQSVITFLITYTECPKRPSHICFLQYLKRPWEHRKKMVPY